MHQRLRVEDGHEEIPNAPEGADTTSILRESFTNNHPVVVRGGMRHSPAAERWTPGYLKERLGEQRVLIYVSRDGDFAGGKGPYDETRKRVAEMSFDEALDRMLAQGGHEPIIAPGEAYYAYQTPSFLYAPILDDLPAPAYLNERSDPVVDPTIWIGAAGNFTPPHTDGWVDNLFAQLHGRKRVWLWEPGEFETLELRPLGPTHSRQSALASSATEGMSSSALPSATYGAVIERGDLLSIPEGWIHALESLEFSLSANYWLAPRPALHEPLRALVTALDDLSPGARAQYLHLLGWGRGIHAELRTQLR